VLLGSSAGFAGAIPYGEFQRGPRGPL
jgi:hypothetical protein